MKTEPVSAAAPAKRILLYSVAYVLWLIDVALCIVAVIQLRAAVNVLWPALGGDRYSLSLVNQLVLLLGALVGFIYVVFLEAHYRDAVTRRVAPRPGRAAAPAPAAGAADDLWRWLAGVGLDLLLRRFAKATAILLAIIVLSLVLLEVGLQAMP